MLPFAVLMLAPALTAIPEELEAAADSLGANWVRTFCHVVLPLARPGLIGAGLVVVHAVAHRFRHAGDPRRRLAGFHRQRHLRPVLPHLGPGPRRDADAAARRRSARCVVGIVFTLFGTGTLGHARRARDDRARSARPSSSGRSWPSRWSTLSAPTLVVLGASFTAGNIITFPPDGLVAQMVRGDRAASDLRAAFLRSLYVATVCTLVADPGRHARRRRARQICGALREDDPGLPASALHHSADRLGHRPDADLRRMPGMLGQLWPVGIACCVINLPFMIWAVTASVNALDPDLENWPRPIAARRRCRPSSR